MDPKELTTQQGMETIFKRFCDNWPEDQRGRINALCQPRFVACSFEKKTLCLGYAVQDWMRNYADVMHGGIVSTVFDLTMGLLAGYCSGHMLTSTVNMQVNFLRPIPAGETLLVEARCDMSGRTLCAVSGAAWLESAPGKFSATATATFFNVSGDKAESFMKNRL